jgi:hypothetical protein
MLKETIDAIGALAVAASVPRVLPLDLEPDHVYAIADPKSGSLQIRQAVPSPRKHLAASPQAVFELAKQFSMPGHNVALWYHRTGLIALLDDDTRRDKVTLPLELSPQIKTLQELEKTPRTFKQHEFRKLLRITFCDCLALCPNLIAIIERVKFRVGGQVEAAVGHGKASVGRQLESEVTGTGSIPEYVDLYVPIFASGFSGGSFSGCRVRCALEPDAPSESFQLIPLPGQIEEAIAWGESQIAKVIAEADLGESVAVYHGIP